MREAAEQEIARVADARGREVRLYRSDRPIRLRCQLGPVPESVGELELERDCVHAVMGRQPLGDGAVQVREASRVVEPAHGGDSRRPGLVGLAEVIRIVDSG